MKRKLDAGFAHHLHWVKTGKATWKLHLAQVRMLPKHLSGSIALSHWHVNLRLLASGRWRYSFNYEKPRPDLMFFQKPQATIEHEFQARLAAIALQGVDTKYRPRWTEACMRCPPETRVRALDRSVQRGTASIEYEFQATLSELEADESRIATWHNPWGLHG